MFIKTILIKMEEDENHEVEKAIENRKKNKYKYISIKKENNFTPDSFTSISKDKKTKLKRLIKSEETIKLESADEAHLHNSMTLCTLDQFTSSLKKISYNNILNMPNFNINKSQLLINFPKKKEEKEEEEEKESENKKEYLSHLIKVKSFVYSYKIKVPWNPGDKIILFECNNKKCKGKGEYDIESKTFRETAEHSLGMDSHRMASCYFGARKNLLNEENCFGYQLLKNDLIKDEKVIMIK